MPVIVSLAVFVTVGAGLIFVSQRVALFLRPGQQAKAKPSPSDSDDFRGGRDWIPLHGRYFVFALIFLIFQVVLALFYPWAVVYGSAADLAQEIGSTVYEIRSAALVDMLFFFTIVLVGLAYLWRFGYLDWIRASGNERPLLAETTTPSQH